MPSCLAESQHNMRLFWFESPCTHISSPYDIWCLVYIEMSGNRRDEVFWALPRTDHASDEGSSLSSEGRPVTSPDPHNDRAEHLGMPGWHQSMTDTQYIFILSLSSSYHPDRNISWSPCELNTVLIYQSNYKCDARYRKKVPFKLCETQQIYLLDAKGATP